jgi:hypothetical protein
MIHIAAHEFPLIIAFVSLFLVNVGYPRRYAQLALRGLVRAQPLHSDQQLPHGTVSVGQSQLGSVMKQK